MDSHGDDGFRSRIIDGIISGSNLLLTISTIIITGGTGLIGTALTALLHEKGHRVIILSRNPSPGNPDAFRWDYETGTIDAEAIRQADHIVHLAGAGVADKRWNAKRKQV